MKKMKGKTEDKHRPRFNTIMNKNVNTCYSENK